MTMKFLVCISKAPDTTSRIAFTEGDTQFDANGVQFIVNPTTNGTPSFVRSN